MKMNCLALNSTRKMHMQEKRVRKSGEQEVLPTYKQVPVTVCTRMTLLRDLNEM